MESAHRSTPSIKMVGGKSNKSFANASNSNSIPASRPRSTTPSLLSRLSPSRSRSRAGPKPYCGLTPTSSWRNISQYANPKSSKPRFSFSPSPSPLLSTSSAPIKSTSRSRSQQPSLSELTRELASVELSSDEFRPPSFRAKSKRPQNIIISAGRKHQPSPLRQVQTPSDITTQSNQKMENKPPAGLPGRSPFGAPKGNVRHLSQTFSNMAGTPATNSTNVAVNLNNVRPRPSSSLPEFPGTPSPGQASYRLSVSQLDKQLPAKPILRAMESPERRGIIDATDVGSSDLIKQYPVLNPLSSSPLGTEIPSSPPSESGLSVGSHVGLIGLPKVRSTKSSVLREQANIARMNGGSRSASDPMTAGTSNSKNYANHEASASRTALGLQDGSINTRTNSFTSVRTASRGSARFAPSSSDKAPNIPLQAISSSGSVASSSEVEGEHDFPLTSKRYSIYGYQYFVHPDARRLLMGDEAQSSAAPAGFGDMMGDMMGNIGSASSKNINFNNDGEAEQVADGFEDVIEDAPLAGNDLMGRFDKSPSIQRGNSNNCRAISHGPAHRHSRSNSEHARRIGSIRRKNRQSQLAEERRTAAAAKALYNLNIPRPVTPVSSIPVRNSSLQSPVIAPTVVPPSGTISSRIATIPGEDKSPGYDRQFSTVIPEQLVQTNHEIADMQPATISKGKEIKTSRLLKFARPTASSSARANKAVKGIGASIKTFSRKVGSKIVRRKDDPVGLPISAPYQTMANRNTEQNIRQQMIDEARLAGLLDDIDESIIGLRPNSAAIENPLLGRLEAEEEVIAAEVVRDNAIEQPRLVDGVIAAEVAQDVASERRQSVNEVQVAEFQEAASIHSVNADLPEAANEVQLPASPRPESIHLVQPAAIVVGLPAPGAADVVDAAGVLDRRGNVIPNRRELAHNRGVAEQILDAVGEIGLFEAEAEYPEFTAIMRRTDYELRELIDMGINVTRTNPAAGNIILADATESVNRFVQLRQRRIDLLVARRQCDHEHMLFFNDFYRLVRRRAAENGNPI